MSVRPFDRRFGNLEGAKRLRSFLDAPGWTQKRLAEVLGVYHGTVYFWTVGFRRPSSEDMRIALKRIAGIPTDAWKTEDEKARARKLRAA